MSRPAARVLRSLETRDVVTAVAGYDIGDLHPLMHSREALVIVRMRRKHGVRPHLGVRADVIDPLSHVFAPAMLRTYRERRMMVGDDERAAKLFRTHAMKRGLQIFELQIANLVGGNDPGSSNTFE